MDLANLKQIDVYLDQLLDMKDGQDAFIEQIELENASIGGELRRLWACHAKASSFLEGTIQLETTESDRPTSPSGRPIGEPEQIGPYRVLQRIGEGGMGKVYLGERADGQFERKIAIKIMRFELHNEMNLARFEHERKILAHLQHPNIAQLIDSGITGHDQPYFIMEFVEGRPITEYCDEMKLSLEDRLELFLQVCEAVHYAHHNLIIHRDLKAGNILVDAEGKVKLLDFGIAKVMEDEHLNLTQLTQTGYGLFTPECASPEQIAGEPITTASDVYSLGILLYQLVSGHHPIEPLSRLDPKLWDMILRKDPPYPSAAVLKPQGNRHPHLSATAIADQRETTPKALSRALSGDIDAIVMKALRKEASSRYEGIDDLKNDVKCYLNGEPVTAHSGTWRYRSKKFMGRHKFALGTLTLIGSILVGFTIALAIQSARLANERDKAQGVSQFLQEMLRFTDPAQQGREAKVIDFVNMTAKNLETRLDEQPETKGIILRVLGQTYRHIGEYEPALRYTQESVELLSMQLGDEHPETTESMILVPRLLLDMGKHEQAMEAINRRIDALKQSGPNNQEELFQAEIDLAHILIESGDLEGGEKLAQSLKPRLETLGTPANLKAPLYEIFAKLAEWRRDAHSAKDYMAYVYQYAIDTLGPYHPDTLNIRAQLADLLTKAEQLEDAVQLLEENAQAVAEVLGKQHPTFDNTRFLLAMTFIKLHRIDEAEEILDECLEFRRAFFGEEHHTVYTILSALTNVYSEQGRFKEAESILRNIVAQRRKDYGTSHPNTIVAIANLAHTLSQEDQLEEAEGLFEEVLDLLKKALPSGKHPQFLATRGNLAWLHSKQGKLDEAEAELRDALEKAKDVMGPQHPLCISLARKLFLTLEKKGELQEATQLAKGVLDGLIQTRGPDHAYTLKADREWRELQAKQAP